MRWTEDQARVITSRGKNLLVAAAAGSGKTTVLVERVLGLVSEGANIDEMLIVTFTRAAAGDMKAKLRKRMSEMASGGSRRAREQLERLENASISTLHSFCAEVLKANFEAAGIDPMFRIIDDAEDKQLTGRAMDEALEDAYREGGADMDALDFARGPERVRTLAMEMFGFLKERPNPEKWFEDALRLIDSDGDVWKNTLVNAARAKLSEAVALYDYAIRLALKPLGPLHYLDVLNADKAALENCMDMEYEPLSRALSAFKQAICRTRVKKTDDPEVDALKTEMMDVRDQAKKAVHNALKYVSMHAEASVRDIHANRGCIVKLYEIAQALQNRLAEYKSRRCALTFNDLEHLTLKALCDERVAQRVKNKYKYVFVDEYQDTSDVQEAIVSRICSQNNLFMVGDVKQSIYRFRQAEPGLYLKKYETYKDGGENELIVLRQNFRSRSSVIDFTNFIFSRVMQGGDSEIVYDDDAKLYRGRDFEGEDKKVEIHLIDKSDSGQDSEEADESASLTDAEREGEVIAARIRSLRQEDPSLKYRDICVITRVRVNALTYLASVLAAEGIPAYADASESYFDALEVMEVMSALRLVVNRRRDVDLISILRSPMVGLTTTQLAKIRVLNRGNSFYDALLSSKELFPKVQELFDRLDEWRILSRSMSVSRLIRHIVGETGFYAYVGALPGGIQRQANIDALCARAANYESVIGGSLPEFLEYARLMQARGDGEGAHTISENDDVVRLMTAHKSKGLEFPVVFASLLGRRFRTSRAEDTLTAHRDLGISLMRVDESLQTMRDTIAGKAIVCESLRQERAEELRIFYVTLTRAQSRLILTGTVRNLPAKLTDWKIGGNYPNLYSSALDIVGAAMMKLKGAEALGASPAENAPEVSVYTYDASSLTVPQGTAPEILNKALEILDRAEAQENFSESMHASITWKYPNESNLQAPLKLTASGLSREITGAFEIPEIAQRPEFLSAGGLTAAERGTAIHAFLRAIDYAPIRQLSGDPMKTALGEQKRKMLEKGLLTPVQGRSVVLSAISDFLTSPMGKRLMRSPRVQREWRFNLKMPASSAIPGASESANVVVQGSIDLCFEENGSWVLLDYKTDRTSDKEQLKSRYAPQLSLYRRALSEITGMPVKETAICLISQGEFINL